MQPDRDELYRRVLRSRLVEQAIATLWQDGRISGEIAVPVPEAAVAPGCADDTLPDAHDAERRAKFVVERIVEAARPETSTP